MARPANRRLDHANVVDSVDLGDLDALRKLDPDQARDWLENRFKEDVDRLCGRRGARGGDTPFRRFDTGRSKPIDVEFGDSVIPGVRVPRIRARDGSLTIQVPYYTAFVEHNKRLVARASVRDALDGLTTRGSARRAVAGDSALRSRRGRSKTSESRRRKLGATLEFREFLTIRHDHEDFAAAMVDGTEYDGRTEIVVVGFTEDGRKVPLTVAEGQRETPQLVARALKRLRRHQGADLSNAAWTVDGGQELRDGIRAVYGPHVHIQNCIEHVARTLQEKLPSLVFHGVNTLVGNALKPGSRSKSLTRAARVEKLLTEAGYAEAGRLVRQRAREICDLRSTLRGRDKERLAAAIFETVRMVEGMVPAGAWVGMNARAHFAWSDPDADNALRRLRALADEMEEMGHKPAADSLRLRMEESVTMTRLGVTNTALHKTHRTNNAIEAINRQLRRRNKIHHTLSRPGAMRMRWVAAQLQEDAQRFTRHEDPEALLQLRQVNLAGLIVRQADGVRVRAELRSDGLIIEHIFVEPSLRHQGRADGTLRELLAWANRRRLPIGLDPVALDPATSVGRLNEWLASYGFVENGDRHLLSDKGLIREPTTSVERAEPSAIGAVREDRDPIEPYAERIGDFWTARLSEMTLTASARVAGDRDDLLDKRASEIEAELARKPQLRQRLQKWQAEYGEDAARSVADEIRAARSRRGAHEPESTRLDLYRGLLGSGMSGRVERRAAELAGQPALQATARDPFVALEEQVKEWMRDSGQLVATQLAIKRELTARRELSAIRAGVQAGVWEEVPPLAELEPNRRLAANAEYLGAPRCELLAASAEAWAKRVSTEDTAVLVRLRDWLGNPFELIDPDDARETLKLERDRPTVVERCHRQRGVIKTLVAHASKIQEYRGWKELRAGDREFRIGWRQERQQVQARIEAAHQELGKSVQTLRELDSSTRQLRSDGTHTDCWVYRFGDVAFRAAALDQVLTKRREQELARLTASQVESTPPEKPAADVAVEIGPGV